MYFILRFNQITFELILQKITREKYINKLFKLQKTFIDSPEFITNRIITERLYNLIFSKKSELNITANIISRKLWETSLLIQNMQSNLSEKIIISSNMFLIKTINKELIKLIIKFVKNNLINDKLNNNNTFVSLKLICIRLININKLNINKLNENILPKNMMNYY